MTHSESEFEQTLTNFLMRFKSKQRFSVLWSDVQVLGSVLELFSVMKTFHFVKIKKKHVTDEYSDQKDQNKKCTDQYYVTVLVSGSKVC